MVRPAAGSGMPRPAGQTASKEVTGSSIELVLKHGPDCGIAGVTIDGKPAATAEVDTYAKAVDWNAMTVVAKDLPAGRHTVVVTVTGRKAAASSNGYVQIVHITGSQAIERPRTHADAFRPTRHGWAARSQKTRVSSDSAGATCSTIPSTAWAKELAPPGSPRGWAIGIAESRDLVELEEGRRDSSGGRSAEKNGIVNGRIILLDGKLHLFYNTYGTRPQGRPLPRHERGRHPFRPQLHQSDLAPHGRLEQRSRD